MTKYTATAIIPVHNRKSLIGRAVASAQQQTLRLDEIIVVDDASTDSTPDVVAQLAQNDQRIQLIRLGRNQGPSRARNEGVKAAQCDWICFLDSDDEWMPEKYARQVEELSRRPQAIASFTGTRHRWATGSQADTYIHEISLDALRERNCLGSPSTAMVKKATLLQVGGFDSTVDSCEDWDLWLRLRQAGEFAIAAEPLVSYSQNIKGRISCNKNVVLAAHSRMFLRTLADIHGRRRRREIVAHHQIRLTQLYFWDFNEPIAALAAVIRSLSTCPTLEAAHLLSQITRSEIRRCLRAFGH